MRAPRLLWPTEVDQPRAVVLVLHGGKSRSRPPGPPVAGRRAADGAVRQGRRRRGRGQRSPWRRSGMPCAAGTVPTASPVADTRLALEQIAAKYPGVPIGLLGHSMGGRVALHLADDERVPAIAALAPWVEPQDRARWHRGLHVLVHARHARPDDLAAGLARAWPSAMARARAPTSPTSRSRATATRCCARPPGGTASPPPSSPSTCWPAPRCVEGGHDLPGRPCRGLARPPGTPRGA